MPQIYRDTRDFEILTIWMFLAWMVFSLAQSWVIFGISAFAYNYFMLGGTYEGKTEDLWATSTCAYFAIVIVHYLTLCTFT
jgi:hypothetical protein